MLKEVGHIPKKLSFPKICHFCRQWTETANTKKPTSLTPPQRERAAPVCFVTNLKIGGTTVNGLGIGGDFYFTGYLADVLEGLNYI